MTENIEQQTNTQAPSLRYAETVLPTAFGDFRLIIFHLLDGLEHVALVRGKVRDGLDVKIRLQSECLTSEVFGSLKCDCKSQLDLAMSIIAKEECGVILYLRQEGRGIGLGNKIKAYHLQETGVDTVDANRMLGLPDDGRDFDCAISILRNLGVASIQLLTNNPSKVDAMVNGGMHVSRRIPHVAQTSLLAKDYLHAKKTRMGHLLEEESLVAKTK